MEMLSLNWGNSFFAMTDQEGQQEVARKGSSSGTFSKKSLASSMVHRSAPTATSRTSWKPTWSMASRT